MPAAYAHYRFGKDVLECLPSIYRKPVETYRELYDIGLHGPDILFYYKPLSSNPVNQTGYQMHDEPALLFFERAASLIKESGNPEALKAYLFGFICHFSLDSACHPYIEKMTSTSGLSHSEIETELDRFLMEKDGLKPTVYIPVEHIHATKEISETIAPCFEERTPQEIRSSLKGMILCHKLLQSQNSKWRKFLYLALKVTGNYNSMHGMVMEPEADERCRESCLRLNQLYTESVTVAVSLIQQYFRKLEQGAPLSSRFDVTFGAGEHWQDILL